MHSNYVFQNNGISLLRLVTLGITSNTFKVLNVNLCLLYLVMKAQLLIMFERNYILSKHDI